MIDYDFEKGPVYYDVDGVLLNWWKNCTRRLGLSYETKDWDNKVVADLWHYIEKSEVFFADLEALSPPDHIVTRVDGYLTACPEHFKKVRARNLKKLGYPDAPVIISHDKVRWLQENDPDAILIDDRPQTVLEGRKVGLKIIQFVPDYFKVGNIRKYMITDLRDLSKYVGKQA